MIRIALGQINPTVGDFSGNLLKINSFINLARERKADIVLFPELALCGYPPEDLLLRKSFIETNRRYLKKLIDTCKGINVICGYAGSRAGKVYNSAAIISGGKLVFSYDKVALPNYGVFDEKRYFQSGSEVPLLSLGDTLIGINICEDIWVAPGVPEQQSSCGAKLILNISSSPYHMHKVDERIDLIRDRAKSNQCYVAYLNTVGGQDELVFDGASIVMAPSGKLIARGRQFVEELIVTDIPIEKTEKARVVAGKRERKSGKSQSDLKVKIVKLSPASRRGQREAVIAEVAGRLPEAEEVYQAVVLGTRDYVSKNGFSAVIIGLSGGVDSALAAAIAVDAIGKENVHTLYMPSRFSSELSREAALHQAHLLGVPLEEISIDELYKLYLTQLSNHFKDLKSGLAEENIQARIRGNLLMAFSNKFGYIVLSTSNKSESAVGYTTLYGDMVGGFAVLKDIPKTLVYDICNHLNRSRGREVIAQEIIDRPPTAELKDGQLDTDSLPAYEILDQILHLYVEHDQSAEDIVAAGFDKKTVARVIRMVDAAEYKRRQSPPGVKITPRSFGKDRRWPITNKF